ncbi:uncharacterized protein LOC133861274 [Alnus glutinosa]|uniref:uncharacterized protein LOC133861274 n=1 Tax=Alnus glutinosa TaxID=3517 RepID=UPI002D776BCE|nr:uncharacterized protein LOC133861274 [Alnus glutinosa]
MWRCKKGRYTCAETWDALRKKEVPEKWWKVVWNQVAIPRHSFMLWLVFRDALITEERMCRWGYSGDLNNPVETWEEVVNWSISNLKKDCLKTRLCMLCLGAAVYHIWKHRNDILHGNIPSAEEAILAKIKWEVRARILVKGTYKKNAENLIFCSSLLVRMYVDAADCLLHLVLVLRAFE